MMSANSAPGPRLRALLGALLCGALSVGGMARAQPLSYSTMASQPDPRDYVTRADRGLTQLGNEFRFAGANMEWLGLRSDTGLPANQRYPTDYEVTDAFNTVLAIGGNVVRAPTLGASVGCALCLMPKQGQFSDAAFAQMDLVLQRARDLGIKLIIPLAGPVDKCGDNRDGASTRDASAPDLNDPTGPGAAGAGGTCNFIHWRGLAGAASFFTDPGVKADFKAYVTGILQHVNTRTGMPYVQDPTILAWENCDDCGTGVPDEVLAAWTEEVGQTIKAMDTHHLYEDGAFAGRIARRAARAVDPKFLSLPSVDIVGDRFVPSDGTNPPDDADLAALLAVMEKAGRAYVVDAFGWSPADWLKRETFQTFMDILVKRRGVAGALVTGLQAHADGGGYLAVGQTSGAAPGGKAPRVAPLYFPGTKTAVVSLDEMQERGRMVRRFAYRMQDLKTPAFLQPPQPEIISIHGGRITWRGAAGAASYSIERTSDPSIPNNWATICDKCTTDADGPWTDPARPKGTVWYRIFPFDANGHISSPSNAVRDVP